MKRLPGLVVCCFLAVCLFALVRAFAGPLYTGSPGVVMVDPSTNLALGGAANPAHVGPAVPPPTQFVRAATAAAGAISVTINSVAGQVGYVTGIEITGLGATAATAVAATLSHVYDFSTASDTTVKWELAVPAGVTTAIAPTILTFTPPLYMNPADASFVLNVPSFGTGNTNVSANIHGFFQ